MVKDPAAPVKRIQRGHMRAAQVLALVQLRYGSTTDFRQQIMSWKDVSKVSGVATATISRAIHNFHKNGDRFVPRRSKGRAAAIPPALQQRMVSQEALMAMRFLPVRERARRHSQELGVPVSHYQLRMIYKANRVRFRQPKAALRLGDERELALIPERILYAEKMLALMAAGRAVIYADETTFQVAAPPPKTWMAGERLVAPRNRLPLRSVTVYGAVSRAIPTAVFLTSTTTNAAEFSRFLDHLAEKSRHLARPVLVLDNHRAHKTADNLAKAALHFEVVFQPPYSSEANAQETVWAAAKRSYLQRLYRRDANLQSQQQFHTFLYRFLEDVGPTLPVRQLAKAPGWWLHAH